MIIPIKKLHPNATIPYYATEGASCFDLSAIDFHTLLPGEIRAIPTGLSMEVPKDYELQVRPRSGLAINKSITVMNSPGTVDSDYRGEIKVILANFSNETFYINIGDRIAQGAISPIVRVGWDIVEQLSETQRGEGGFGSTGINETTNGN